ncbi:response regulator [Phenylobacterium sp.]|uniref:response regulator n=1 Tax=Phenylobacterium sp. TaxID=1871053 RepID=UPI002DE3608C|nr:response regulator [Phenylobacterium sp.]
MTEPLSPVLVLAVDDDVLVLDLLQSALEDGGFQVKTALGGDEAIAALEMNRARDICAVVTDVNLGRGTNGWDVGQRARELSPGLPVLYISGDSAHDWTSRGVPRSLLVQKPFAPAQIVTAVASLINQQIAAPDGHS